MELKYFLTVFAFVFVELTHGDDYCFGKDRDRVQTRQFATKTAYQIVKGTNIEKQYLVPNCEPTKMWIYHRHGTRLPSEKFINQAQRLEELRDEIVANYRVRRTKPDTNALCLEDLIALQTWHWNTSIVPENANFLTSQGYEDLRGTAKLYQRYYPQVLTRPYNPQAYLFRHSNKQRTIESFKAFAEGLFGSDDGVEPATADGKNLLLQPYEYCESWQENKKDDADDESEKFHKTSIYQRMIQDTSTRLGFLYNLTESDIELMFDMCSYEQAWHIDRTSVWCAVFLPEQVTLLEYDEDLKHYYKAGYGFPENEHLSCATIKDMLIHLESNSEPRAVAYFSHSSGLVTLLTGLGINKDDLPLKADNLNEQTYRRFQTSKTDPFAANFLAVKYQCPTDALNPEKVVFFLNQNAVNLDWCNVGLCNWSEVQKRYANFRNADCAQSFCSGSQRVFTSTLLIIFTAIFYLIH